MVMKSQMNHIQKLIEARCALAGIPNDDEIPITLTETQMFIGLNDADTNVQKYDTTRYVKLLRTVCAQYEVQFSFNVIGGGCIHDSGEVTEETTISLTFFDVDYDTVTEIAKDLCVFFNQESILVTTGLKEVRFVRERL